MSILHLLADHKHYWGIPHERPADKRIIEVCYECGAEREIKVELHASVIAQDEGSRKYKRQGPFECGLTKTATLNVIDNRSLRSKTDEVMRVTPRGDAGHSLPNSSAL